METPWRICPLLALSYFLWALKSWVHGAQNQDSRACKDECQQSMCAAFVFTCFGGWWLYALRVLCHGVYMYGIAIVEEIWMPTGIYWN